MYCCTIFLRIWGLAVLMLREASLCCWGMLVPWRQVCIWAEDTVFESEGVCFIMLSTYTVSTLGVWEVGHVLWSVLCAREASWVMLYAVG